MKSSSDITDKYMNTTKIVYISGPISGLQNGNMDRFQKAQAQLEKEGFVVMNPHELGKELYEKWSKNPPKTKEEEEEMWREFMKVDIKFLTLAEKVFVLDNCFNFRPSLYFLWQSCTIAKIFF